MAVEDVWSLLTRQLYPDVERSNSSSGSRTRDGTGETKDGDEAKAPGGGGAGEATEREGTLAAACAFTSYALCVGMHGAGKSSLLNSYLNPNNDAIPKPTVALEYMFARRPSAANAPKDVAHIWELGGGSHVSDLVRVPITPDRFHNALYVIVVDLSKPSSVIPHLLHWTDQIKACVKVCVRELAKRDPAFAEALKRKTYAKLGQDHPDLRAVRPCPVPLVIVGNKYDIFKNQESVRRRTLAQALRFIAHINGASLLFCSKKEKRLKDVFRLTINTGPYVVKYMVDKAARAYPRPPCFDSQHLFRASGRKPSETNPERPLVVPAGSDSLDAILKTTPPGTRREDFISGNSVAEGALNAWKRAVVGVFGAADPADELPANRSEEDYGDGGSGGVDENPFPEASVDEHRAQRDEMLRRYRKDAERKAKLAMKATDVPRKSFAAAHAPPARRQSNPVSEARAAPVRK